MMNLRLLFLFLLFLSSVITWAEKEMLVVLFKDESKVEFILEEIPKVEFNHSDSLTITSQTLVGQYLLETIKNFHFESAEPTKIKPVKKGEQNMRIFYRDNSVVEIEGLDEKTNISLYSIAGQLEKCNVLYSNGKFSISLNDKPAGIYIVRVSGNKSFKIIKK